jgi:WD40 repeat protein
MALPALFGGYELLGEIGRGGMGVVYRARQVALNRTVALKLLLHGRFTDAAFLDRFHLEAEAAAHLDHPNIVPIHEVGVQEGQPYYSMKLIEGRSLEQLIAECRARSAERRRETAECGTRNGGWVRRSAELVATIARAVHHAHQHGVLHRDIKPHNILLDAEGRPYLTDFGLAKLLNEDTGLTVSVAVIGSPGFMSPEQAAGKTREITTAADIYGLGAVLYAMLTGKAVFQADTPLETVRLVIEQEPVRPRTLNPAVDRDLETICLKCLQKEPAKRYPSALALAEDLESWLRAEPIQARRVTEIERVWLWCRRKPALATAMGAVVLVALAGLVGILTQLQRAKANELFARRTAYASDINLAQRALEADDVNLAVRLLAKHRPDGKAGGGKQKAETDLRGWEWRYLWQLCQPDESVQLQPQTNSHNEMAISQDGRVLAVQTGGEMVAVWDLMTRRQQAKLPASRTIQKLALSATGARLASSTHDARGEPTVEVWDGNPPTRRIALDHPAPLRSLALSPDGTLLATYDEDEKISLVEWASNRVLTNFVILPNRHHQGVLAFSPDGHHLAIGEDYGRLSVLNWRTESMVTMTNRTEGGSAIKALAFLPSAEVLAAGTGGYVRLWDTDSGQLRGELPAQTGDIIALAFTPDGRRLASATSDRIIRIWDVAEKTELCHFRGHEGEGWALAFLPDRNTLVSACDIGTACFWDVTSTNRNYAHATLTISYGVNEQSALGPTNFAVLDPKTIRRFGFTFTADGQHFITTDTNGVLGVWETASLRKTETLSGLGSNYWGAALSPDGLWLATGDADGRISVWEWPTCRRVANFEHPFQWCGRIQFSRSGRFLWAWTSFKDWTARFGIWRVEDWQEVTLPGVNLGGLFAAELSPDDRHLAVGFRDGSVKVWSFPSGRPEATFTNHQRTVWSVTFSPDGRLLASASWDRNVKLWEPSSGRELATLRGHSANVYGAAFSPDGRRLATGGSSAQQAVKLWDIATHRELLTLEGEGELFTPVAFSPDGNTLFATSFTGVAHLWRAPSRAEIEAAEKRDGLHP